MLAWTVRVSPLPEKIVGAVTEPDKRPRQTAHTAGQADAVLAFFSHLRSRSTVPSFSSRWRSVTLGSSAFRTSKNPN